MKNTRRFYFVSLLATISLFSGLERVNSAQPTRFTFTPTFQDPDPGRRFWEKRGDKFVETLPSGRMNTFRIKKQGVVNGLRGTIIQKIEEPNFYVFIADSEAKRKELWWWRANGPWKFMGTMDNITAPVRID